jgi:lipopolysaccharide transport system ATP-binding protein
MLAGIYEPTSGTCSVVGKVVSLLDVTLGMDYESTGYENIILRGLMHGLTRREILLRASEIAEFSELGDYIYMPVRVYSSGMLLRLAFSIATALTADIILMDEWLSVGDASFVAKAERRLRDMVNKASILVLASHSEAVVDSLCNRVVHLEHGRVVRVNSQEEKRGVGA